MSMTILALDLATKTGWAVARDGKIIASGVQDFALRRGESHGLMFLRARRWCLDTARTAEADLLAYEGPLPGRCGYGGLRRVGNARPGRCCGTRDRVHADPYGDFEKVAPGSGTSKKREMMAVALAKTGRTPKDDNEADAMLLALYASEQV